MRAVGVLSLPQGSRRGLGVSRRTLTSHLLGKRGTKPTFGIAACAAKFAECQSDIDSNDDTSDTKTASAFDAVTEVSEVSPLNHQQTPNQAANFPNQSNQKEALAHPSIKYGLTPTKNDPLQQQHQLHHFSLKPML